MSDLDPTHSPPTEQPDPDIRRHADIAAKIRQQYADPLDQLMFTYAYESGVLSVQVQQLRDALVRFGVHNEWCAVAEAMEHGQPIQDVYCCCGLDQAIRGGSR